jgi:predicted nucleotidyltransferase
MKVLGIIAEYNPFHNGHLYHLEQSRALCCANYAVCVMSGNFIQRGEPAMINKWARTHSALLSGIDLVLELPSVYAMSSAEFFAFGGVKILDSLGIVDYVSFGSESGNLEELDVIADILDTEPEPYKVLLKKYLDSGLSYPAARERALAEYFKQKDPCFDGIESMLGQSNNILGIEYLKAIKKLGSSIVPITINRIDNIYGSQHITGSVSSATAIRKAIKDNREESYDIPAQTMPKACINILKKEFECGRGPVSAANFENMILTLIRKMTQEQIKDFPYISEGLENRIKEAADSSGTLEELIEKICTRRYTRTRVQRILFSFLTDLKSSEFESFNENGGPQYIRVLGFNSRGQKLLAKIKDTASLPIIVKTANFKSTDNPLLNRMLEIESHATDMYVLGYNNPEFRQAGQEFTQNVVRI